MNVNDVVLCSRFHLNQSVKTPLGVGMYQAPFAVVDGSGATVVTGVLVKLPVNEETGKAVKQANCLTPGATLSGLWVFQEGEIS